MGPRNSTLCGRADVDGRALSLTMYDSADVAQMLARHRHDLGGRLALETKHFAKLLKFSVDAARPLFERVFDTDSNKLVDA